MKINKNSLQAKIKKLSSQKGVPSNVILQDYLYTSKFNTITKIKEEYLCSYLC